VTPWLVVVALLIASPASAAWRRVDSPNFIVVGDASARDLRAMATKFEAFRETLRRVLPAVTSASPVPTVVVVFPSENAFLPYAPTYQGKPRRDVGGYAMTGRSVNYIAVRNDGNDFTDRAILHEYTHLIVANALARMPIWLNEGLAEFYSTFTLLDGGKRAQIGRPIGEHLGLLDGTLRVPLVELLKADRTSPLYNEGNRASAFYAESWALTHMLLSGRPSHVKELSDYLQRVNAGTDEKQAWQQVFGEQTETTFREYVTRLTFAVTVIDFAEKIATVPLVEKTLSPAAAASFLAGLQLRRNGPDSAAALLEPTLTQEPQNALALATMAQIALARRDSSEALDRLMWLSTDGDWFVAYTAAMTLAESAAFGPRTEAVPARLTRATALLEQVEKDHADLPNVLATLAEIDAIGGNTPAPAAFERIARARALAPGRVEYVLTQAELYANARDFVRARAIVAPLMSPLYPDDVRSGARRLMGGLVALEQSLQGRGPSDAAAATTAGAAATAASTGPSRSVAVPDIEGDKPRTTGAPRFRPNLRQLQPGEQRLDGMLEQIDCAPGKPAVLRVRTGSEVVELEAQMAQVQFVAYRDDLTGGVSCGKRTPMHVYATWREGTTPRHEKVVVAVEFLPKD
jgi:hypothetical protein